VSKSGKAKRTPPDDPVFGDDILHELDELLLNETVAPGKKPAAASLGRSPAEPPAAATPKPKGDPENRRQAQELATQARNAQEPKKAVHLAKQALAMDRNCVDAWVMLAHLSATAPDELAEGLERAVERGQRALGEEFIAHYAGRLWSQPEARPYLQARHELADVLRDMGRSEEAIQHYEALMQLDAGDHLRVRDALVAAYLAAGYIDDAGRLLAKFVSDETAGLAWSRVLERFSAKDMAGALAALVKARRANHWAEDYLAGRKPMPQHTINETAQGSDYEARRCAANLLPAMVEHPRFAVWLGQQQAKR
jgi:tetratricopeptide (TPR) repeat protein